MPLFRTGLRDLPAWRFSLQWVRSFAPRVVWLPVGEISWNANMR